MPRIFSFRLQCGRSTATSPLHASQVLQGRALPDGVVGAQRGTAALAIGVNERSSGLDDDRNVTLSLLFGWPIMLPERMRARRAPSSGKARGTTAVATHGPIVARPNAGTRITTRHVNPTPSAALALNSAKASTVLLCCCGARVCKGYNREKADGRQITHCILALLLTASTQGEPPALSAWGSHSQRLKSTSAGR